MMYLVGGDFSLYDPVLDWKSHTWKYAFIKASEGTVKDPRFEAQWKAARGYVYRAAYHFFRPSIDWLSAAIKFCDYLYKDPGELPPILDLESTDGVDRVSVVSRAIRWLREVRTRTGKTPIVYTAPFFIDLVHLYNYPEFDEYPLWMATYPWDKIQFPWTEAKRAERIRQVISGEYTFIFPRPRLPWTGAVEFTQWTGKCPPEYVPGYPLGVKDAVDINFYNGDLEKLKNQFRLGELPPIQGDDTVEPITWKADLKTGQSSNFRPAPGLSAGLIRPLTGPLHLEGTGEKLLRDGYYWGEVVTINGVEESGWIAFTTSYENVQWVTPTPTPATQPITISIGGDGYDIVSVVQEGSVVKVELRPR